MISIYLKTMAGEIFPMEVNPSDSLLEIAQQATAQDPEQFPSGRTKVMRMEEQEEQKEDLTAEETLLVFITEGLRLESGVFPEGGKKYHRWVIPFRGRTLYLYTSQWFSRFTGQLLAEYAASWSPEVTKPSALCSSMTLYVLMKAVAPDVTPQEMTMLYDIVLPYYQELSEKTGRHIDHEYSGSEPLICGCGSVIQRKSMRTHVHTKKHKAWEKTQ